MESMLFVIFALCVGLYGLVWVLCGCLLGFELLASAYSWLTGQRRQRTHWQIGLIVASIFVGFGLFWPVHRSSDLYYCFGTTFLIVGLLLFFAAPLYYCFKSIRAYDKNESSGRINVSILLMPLCGISGTLMIATFLILLVQLFTAVNSIWF